MSYAAMSIGSDNWLRVSAPASADNALREVSWMGRHQQPGGAWVFPRATARLVALVHATLVNVANIANVQFDEQCRRFLEEAAIIDSVTVDIRARADELPPVPQERFPSYPHQRVAHWIMREAPAHLAGWDMRTGKTKFAIDCIINHGWRFVLIACPNKIVPVWVDHFQTHATKPYVLLELGEKVRGGVKKKVELADRAWQLHLATEDSRPLVIVVNYESIWRQPFGPTRGARNRITQHGWALTRTWDCVIGDESHRFGKPHTQISRFMERMHHVSRRRICLSGTPASHSPLDIFGQYRFLDPTILGSFWTPFVSKYAVMRPMAIPGRDGQTTDIICGYQHMDELKEKMHSIATFVKLRDVVKDLPPDSDVMIPVEMGPKESKAYDELWNEMCTQVGEGIVTADNALAKIVRVQQVTSGFLPTFDPETEKPKDIVELDGSKAAVLTEIIGDLDPDEPIAVYCRFRHDLDAVHRVAESLGRTCNELSGRINEIGHRWEPQGGAVAAVQIQSGKEGIDMSAAAYAVIFSTGCPSVGDFDQLMARHLGPRQKRPVTRYHLVCRDSIDVIGYKAREERRDIIRAIVDAASGVFNNAKPS